MRDRFAEGFMAGACYAQSKEALTNYILAIGEDRGLYYCKWHYVRHVEEPYKILVLKLSTQQMLKKLIRAWLEYRHRARLYPQLHSWFLRDLRMMLEEFDYGRHPVDICNRQNLLVWEFLCDHLPMVAHTEGELE